MESKGVQTPDVFAGNLTSTCFDRNADHRRAGCRWWKPGRKLDRIMSDTFWVGVLIRV